MNPQKDKKYIPFPISKKDAITGIKKGINTVIKEGATTAIKEGIKEGIKRAIEVLMDNKFIILG